MAKNERKGLISCFVLKNDSKKLCMAGAPEMSKILVGVICLPTDWNRINVPAKTWWGEVSLPVPLRSGALSKDIQYQILLPFGRTYWQFLSSASVCEMKVFKEKIRKVPELFSRFVFLPY